MRPTLFRVLLVLALLAPLWSAAPSAGSSAETSHFFAETGHTVSDLFWQYWQSHGGLDLFGYPLSDEFTETNATDGKPYTVQYFERAVFEIHPANTPAYNVLLALLGTQAYAAKYPHGAPGQQPAAGGTLFPATGHRIGGRFLSYWQSHGGLANLGYPLTDEFTEQSALNGHSYRVQYFERAVMELHPENAGTPYEVLLAQLGTLHWQQKYPHGAPQQPGATVGGPAPLPGDWPMYGRDAQHTSYNGAEKTISPSNVNALVPLWQADLGAGANPPSSAPSIANGHVYVGSGVKTGPNFFAFNTAGGALAWKVDLGYKDTCFRIGIGATAAISGSLVVAGGGDGAFYGLDAATGKTLWRDATDHMPDGFAWTSPLFAGGRAVYGMASYCDRPQIAGEVRAINPTTGLLRNALQLVPGGQIGASLWNSPALSPDGNTLVLATGEDRGGDASGPYSQAIMALDPATFAVRAYDRQGPFEEAFDVDWGTSPVIFHDASGRLLVGAHSKNDKFYAYDLNNISAGPIWAKHIGTQIGLMAAYDPTARPGGILFVTAKSGFLYAVDPATGNNLWYAQDLGVAHGNIAVANGLIFMNITNEGVRVLDEQTGKVLRLLVPAHLGATYSGIAVANGVLYWLSGQYLNAWGLRSP